MRLSHCTQCAFNFQAPVCAITLQKYSISARVCALLYLNVSPGKGEINFISSDKVATRRIKSVRLRLRKVPPATFSLNPSLTHERETK